MGTREDLQLAQNASVSFEVSPLRNSRTSLPTARAPMRRACNAVMLLLSVTLGLSIARKSSILAVMYARCRLPFPSSGGWELKRRCRGEAAGEVEGVGLRLAGRFWCHSVRRTRRGCTTSIVASRLCCSLVAARMEKSCERTSVTMSVSEQSWRKKAAPGRSGSSKSISCRGETSQSSGLMWLLRPQLRASHFSWV